MDQSIFMDKSAKPTESALKEALGDQYELWKAVRDRVIQVYPGGIEEWNFPGKKYGWSFRIKDKKRAIIYLLPRLRGFIVAFVFGKRAYEAILESDVSGPIKSELQQAKVYAEGRGIRIPVPDSSPLQDIFQLIDIKLAY
jgi:hypothetical protein